MHLLYLDDSGSVANAQDEYIVLAGLSLFERQPHWHSAQLDQIAKEFWPDKPQALEFRGTDIMTGKKHWRGVGKADRSRAYREALGILSASKHVRLFGAAIHKASLSPHDPMEFAFEHLCNRFDLMLGRLHKGGDTQRGLLVLDDSAYETSLQALATEFRTEGHRWGQLFNFADVPLFVNSKATRMIQFADLVAHAVRRYYEKGDNTLFDIIANKFDSVGGVVHGLYHHAPQGSTCVCPSCAQKHHAQLSSLVT